MSSGRGSRGRGRGRGGSNTRGDSRGKNWSTTLPSSLESELIKNGSLKANYASRGRGGRKERRKDDRQDAKLRKQAWFNSSKKQGESNDMPQQKDVKGKRKQREEPELSENERVETPASAPPKKKVKKQQPDVENDKPSRSKKITADAQTPLSRLLAKQGGSDPQPSTSRPRASGSRSAVEDTEDQEIAWLEYTLGVGKKNSKHLTSEMQEDGLDDLFADIDRLEATLADNDTVKSATRGELMEEDSAEEHVYDHSESDEEDQEDLDDLVFMSGDDSAEDVDFNSDNESEATIEQNEEDWQGIDSSAEDATDASNTEASISGQPPPFNQAVSANPVETALRAKYVPPHLRAQAIAPSALKAPEQDARLNRLLSGQLNKLSPTNIVVIVAQTEELYTQHPRALITTALTTLVVDRVAGSQDVLGETNILTFATFVASFYGKGMGLRESVITECLQRWDKRSSDAGKERNNIVRLWSRLYNLGVLACPMIYGVIRELIEGQTEGQQLVEDDVEALLIVIKTSGQKLRSDDPSALKQITQLVEQKYKLFGSTSLSSRTKFMIETLNNLKNNRIKADPGSSGTGSAASTEEAMRKFLNGLAKKRGDSLPEALRFTLEELRASSTRGKWWQTGAAWSGNPLQEASANGGISLAQKTATGSAKWAKLARKQGMNTDIRRAIFVALIDSEDYVDACDRVLQIGLTEKQQREVVKVILHCCGNESTYNPFYSLVVQRMLNQSSNVAHSFAITLQYALWDLFREMGESQVGGQERLAAIEESDGQSSVNPRRAQNIARAYGWWLAKGNLSLTILKPLPFTSLKRESRVFLKHLFTTLFLSSQTSSPMLTNKMQRIKTETIEQVFLKVAMFDNLARGLRFVLETDFSEEASGNAQITEMAQIAMDTLSLGSGRSYNDVY